MSYRYVSGLQWSAIQEKCAHGAGTVQYQLNYVSIHGYFLCRIKVIVLSSSSLNIVVAVVEGVLRFDSYFL